MAIVRCAEIVIGIEGVIHPVEFLEAIIHIGLDEPLRCRSETVVDVVAFRKNLCNRVDRVLCRTWLKARSQDPIRNETQLPWNVKAHGLRIDQQARAVAVIFNFNQRIFNSRLAQRCCHRKAVGKRAALAKQVSRGKQWQAIAQREVNIVAIVDHVCGHLLIGVNQRTFQHLARFVDEIPVKVVHLGFHRDDGAKRVNNVRVGGREVLLFAVVLNAGSFRLFSSESRTAQRYVKLIRLLRIFAREDLILLHRIIFIFDGGDCVDALLEQPRF